MAMLSACQFTTLFQTKQSQLDGLQKKKWYTHSCSPEDQRRWTRGVSSSGPPASQGFHLSCEILQHPDNYQTVGTKYSPDMHASH